MSNASHNIQARNDTMKFGVIGQQANNLKSQISQEGWLQDHKTAEVRAEFVRQVVAQSEHLLEEGLKFDTFVEGLAAKEDWSAELYAEHEQGRDAYMMAVAACLTWAVRESHGLDHDWHERAKKSLAFLKTLMSEDDDSYFHRTEVQESIKRAEADFAAGRYDVTKA